MPKPRKESGWMVLGAMHSDPLHRRPLPCTRIATQPQAPNRAFEKLSLTAPSPKSTVPKPKPKCIYPLTLMIPESQNLQNPEPTSNVPKPKPESLHLTKARGPDPGPNGLVQAQLLEDPPLLDLAKLGDVLEEGLGL